VVLESRVENVVVPRTFLRIAFPGIMAYSMETHHPHPLSPLRIFSCCHSPFACRDCLSRIERETGDVSNRSNSLAVIVGRQCVSGILNHFQIVTSGKLQDRGHITWLAAEMNRNNCLSSWSNGAFNFFGIEV